MVAGRRKKSEKKVSTDKEKVGKVSAGEKVSKKKKKVIKKKTRSKKNNRSPVVKSNEFNQNKILQEQAAEEDRSKENESTEPNSKIDDNRGHESLDDSPIIDDEHDDHHHDDYEYDCTEKKTTKSRKKSVREKYEDIDAIKQYLKEISKVPLLSFEKEQKLAYKVLENDAEARQTLIISNLRLVISIAKRYLNRGLSMLDLIEEGNIGLMKAVEKFEPEKGFRFSTYAAWWIKQHIMRALANQSNLIRLPVHVVEKVSKLARMKYELVQRLRREPSIQELARALEMSEEQITEILRIEQKPAYLETLIGGWNNNSKKLVDILEDQTNELPDASTKDALQRKTMMQLLDGLADKEKAIIKMRFGLENDNPCTLEEAGRHFGLTRERIRQIEMTALKKLRAHLREGHISVDELLKD